MHYIFYLTNAVFAFAARFVPVSRGCEVSKSATRLFLSFISFRRALERERKSFERYLLALKFASVIFGVLLTETKKKYQPTGIDGKICWEIL